MALSSVLGYLNDEANLDKLKKLYYIENGKKKALNIGAFQTQSVGMSNTLTKNPVEFGANLSDHMYKNADTLQVAIIVGDSTGLVESVVNTVKNVTGSLATNLLQGLQDTAIDFIDGNSTGNYKSSKVFKEIVNIKQNFLPCEIVTRDRIYTNLQILNISRVIELSNYNGAIIILDLEEVMTFGTDETNSLISSIKKNGFMVAKNFANNLIGRFT